MANRPKDIGTAAETAVVRAARRLGFPQADRLTLTGSQDRGDIGLCPGVIVEVKGGAAAKDASDLLVEAWLAETERERRHAHADIGFLVVQRRGVGAPNAHRWHAYWRHGWIANLRAYPTDLRDLITDQHVIRMSLDSALAQLRAAGYGQPLDTSDTALQLLRTRLAQPAEANDGANVRAPVRARGPMDATGATRPMNTCGTARPEETR